MECSKSKAQYSTYAIGFHIILYADAQCSIGIIIYILYSVYIDWVCIYTYIKLLYLPTCTNAGNTWEGIYKGWLLR